MGNLLLLQIIIYCPCSSSVFLLPLPRRLAIFAKNVHPSHTKRCLLNPGSFFFAPCLAQLFATPLTPFAKFHLLSSCCQLDDFLDFNAPLQPNAHFWLACLSHVGLLASSFHSPSHAVCKISLLQLMLSTWAST